MTRIIATYGGPRAWNREVKMAGPTALEREPTAVRIPITVPCGIIIGFVIILIMVPNYHFMRIMLIIAHDSFGVAQ